MAGGCAPLRGQQVWTARGQRTRTEERMRLMIQKRTQGYKVCAPTATNRSTIRYRQPVQVDGTMKGRERVGTGEDRHYGPIDLKTWYDGNDREKERLWRLYSTTYAMRHAA